MVELDRDSGLVRWFIMHGLKGWLWCIVVL
jgi:hypothetical protein